MTQDELEILDRARSWLENFALCERSCLLGGELSRLAYSLDDIINKYRKSNNESNLS